jgi:uncharacterized integral membrane protein
VADRHRAHRLLRPITNAPTSTTALDHAPAPLFYYLFIISSTCNYFIDVKLPVEAKTLERATRSAIAAILYSKTSGCLLASMVNTQRFGLLAATGAIVAFLADLIVAPALLTLATRHDHEAPAVHPLFEEPVPGES